MRLLACLSGAAALVAGCAATVAPPAEAILPTVDRLTRGFALEGRLSVRSAAPQSVHARLTWRHDLQGDELLLSTPFGQGLAKLSTNGERARLETADGEVLEAATPDGLSARALGFPLPVAEGANWVLGRPGPEGRIVRADGDGRALEVSDRGWRIEYLEYEGDGAASPPRRIVLTREDIEVRVVVDRWEAVP